MAKLIIQFQGGAPTVIREIGEDPDAIAMMREVLAGDPVSIPNIALPTDESPMASDWENATEEEVVEGYVDQLLRSSDRLQKRGRRFIEQ